MKILRLAIIATAFTALILGSACRTESNDAAPEPTTDAPAADAPAADAPAADAPAAQPDAAPAATGAAIRLAPDFLPDPHTASGQAGGSVDASAGGEETQWGDCVGFIPGQPQHTMELTAAFEYLKVSATSDIDTSLVIEGPEGKRCNDDDEDLNPAIEGSWPAGTYRVFVGSYDQEETSAYTLSITEIQ